MFGHKQMRPPAPDTDGSRDLNLPMLSVPQAQRLAVIAASAFARQGMEVVSDGQGALVGPGQTFGLHNLATVVADLPWHKWPAAADRHAVAMVAAAADASSVGLEQVLLKLRAAADLSAPPDFDASSRPQYGCLIILPNRHLLGVHIVEGIGMIAAIRAMAAAAVNECRNRPGPIADEVFYLPPDGPAQSIVDRAEDGNRTVNAAEGPFLQALTALGLVE